MSLTEGISLIVCSRHRRIGARLERNVEETIGSDHEWVVVDNSAGRYGIAAAYEEAAMRARASMLCFMHDDILFHTPNWGQAVLRHLADRRTGVLGVVGGHLLSAAPSTWFSTPYRSGQYMDGKDDSPRHGLVEYRQWWDGGDCMDVAAVDGFWMCIPKKHYGCIRFGAGAGGKFHGYDLDICLQSWAAGWAVKVAGDILIEHFSTGDTGLEWLDALEAVCGKWKGKLPLVKGIALPDREVQRWEDRLAGSNYWCRKYLQEKKLHDGVLRSASFRLGRALTWPLRMIRTGGE
jgi:hypothetical protein